MNKVVILTLFLITGVSFLRAQSGSKNKPNFIVIVADDMGFSDLGAFGGEMLTPNLDKLSAEGVRFTNFYVAPTCSPTRSMLLTGIDNHLVGLGNMYEYPAPNQLNMPGYEGILNRSVPTLPEILKDNGYHTYMAGKWHLGKGKENIPYSRGFERSFSMLSGSGSYFSLDGPDEETTPNHYVEDSVYLSELPKKYYATKTFTDKIIEYIDINKGDGKPFFAYLAHQAPHDPLMVPNDFLRKYQGVFDEGWDVLRDKRLERMVKMGVISEKTVLGERLWYIPGFDKLKPLNQIIVARKMEVYAAVLDYMDMEIGRLMTYLKENNLKENTYVIFFSDNGPDINDKSATYKKYPGTASANWMAKTYTHGYQNWGREGSFTAYGAPWAQVSSTPFYGFKYTTYEGGIRSPLIVSGPLVKDGGLLNKKGVLHVKDILPTIIDLAGIDYNRNINTHQVQGLSWYGMLRGDVDSPRNETDYIGTELWNCKSIRKADWKIVWVPKPIGTGEWQLFNVVNDPGESNDLAEAYPEKLRELKNDWETYKKDNNVILPNRTIYDGMVEKLPPRPMVYDPDFGRGSEKVK
ncbi:arylsulfatase [bacterium SCSIO 12643]|nr:arylsulfatase [bacterium SCSIO 12643]